MRRILRTTLALLPVAVAICVTCAATARAATANPDPRNTTFPAHINLVGCGTYGPDSVCGHFQVRCLDLIGNPIANADIVLDFSQCTDVAFALDQRDPRLTIICPMRSVRAATDAAGYASFTLLGAGNGGPPSGRRALYVFANGVIVGSASVGAFDRDGVGGLTPVDLRLWTADFYSDTHPAIADLDGDGRVTLMDLSVWAGPFFSGAQWQSAGPYCP